MLPKDVQEKLKAASMINDDKARAREIDKIIDRCKGQHPELFVEDAEDDDE